MRLIHTIWLFYRHDLRQGDIFMCFSGYLKGKGQALNGSMDDISHNHRNPTNERTVASLTPYSQAHPRCGQKRKQPHKNHHAPLPMSGHARALSHHD